MKIDLTDFFYNHIKRMIFHTFILRLFAIKKKSDKIY